MKVTVIGSGYVGLVSGACLAEVGNEVICLDTDPDKIRTLKNGVIPIHEPGLQEMVQRNMAAGRLGFTTDVLHAARFGQVQFIAVGTPPDTDGSADLQHVLEAARNIGRYMREYTVVADKSTVPVGTAEKVHEVISMELAARGENIEFSVVSNPEFLKEGAAIEDFMRPDRIVIGCSGERAKTTMRELYTPFQRNHERLIFMDVKSAELTKYAANAMLATRISFMNELANLAEELDADIEMVRRGMGSDPRIGYHFLYPGCGYGGSCFPKDIKALIKTANDDAGKELQVLKAVESANEHQKHILSEKIKSYFGYDLSGRHFALWGLAFKPDTDDMREAPSRALISDLLALGATISAYDPVAMPEARRIYGDEHQPVLVDSPLQAAKDADGLLIVTEWKEFRAPDFDALRKLMKKALIFDGRNLYDPDIMRGHGFEYYAIGRK